MRDFDASRNCGVSYWSKMDGKRLVEHLKEAYEDPGVKELFLEQVPLHVYGGSCQVAVVLCFEQDVTENDTYVELKNADSIYAWEVPKSSGAFNQIGEKMKIEQKVLTQEPSCAIIVFSLTR